MAGRIINITPSLISMIVVVVAAAALRRRRRRHRRSRRCIRCRRSHSVWFWQNRRPIWNLWVFIPVDRFFLYINSVI